MKRSVLLFFTIFAFNICQGQILDNKVRIYYNYTIGGFNGKEMLTDGNFTAPSLFANCLNLTGFSFKGLIKTGPVISMGVAIERLKASGWELLDNADYSNSSVSLYSLSPVIQIHNKFKEPGFSNRFKIYAEVAPVAGYSKLTLTNPLFDIRSNEYNVSTPLNSSDFFLGIKGAIGVEFAINQVAGICCSYSLSYNRISSKLYSDTHFSASQVQVGAFVKLIKDKRFFY
jgi:hypothetical protein